jgi:hypothetical protein
MQLLCSRATPGPEFLSLSVTFKGDIAEEKISYGIIEPFLLPSPVSTISQTACIDVLKELHYYVNSMSKASKSKKGWDDYRMATALFQEDGKLQSEELEVFRPLKGHGIGLHYRVIKDPKSLSILVPLIFESSRATATPNKVVESDVSGVIMCIGMSGLPSCVVTSPLHYSISQRMRDCLQILAKTGTKDMNSAKTLMTTLLLTEDEDKMTNLMADGLRSSLLDDDKKMRTRRRRKRTAKLKSKGVRSNDHDDDFDILTNSADKARIMVERLQVLSVAETGTIFKKFEGRANDEKSSKKRRKAAADLDGFDYNGEKMGSTGRRFSNNDAGSGSGNSKGPLLQSIRDSKRPSIPRQSRNKLGSLSAPGKGAPGKDTRLQRSSNDSGAGNNRKRNSRMGSGDMTAFSSFDSLGSNAFNESEASPTMAPTGVHPGRGSRNIIGNANSVGDGTVSTASETTMESNLANDATPRFQINVALNEDLTCFYKLSKMSACSVEGVIQVQVKSNTQSGFPFHLSIRDPLRHIQSIQENKKFAEITDKAADDDADHLFTVTVPKGDNYFPVMKYKCANELRPVPIVSIEQSLSAVSCFFISFSYLLNHFTESSNKSASR